MSSLVQNCLSFKVLTPVLLKAEDFWDVPLCFQVSKL